jgi:hypothetical protein
MVDETKLFTAEDGTTYRLKRINRVLLDAEVQRVRQEWIDADEPIEIPTYTITADKSDPQTFQHRVTEKSNTLDVKDDPEQSKLNWAIWNKHLDALERLTVAQQEAKTKMCFSFCLECELPEDDDWREMVEYAGVEIPKDKPGERFAYLWYHALSMYDKQQLIPMFEMLSLGKMVKPEQMELFRSRISGAMDEKAKQVMDEIGDAFDDALAADGELDGGDEVHGTQGGEGEGDSDRSMEQDRSD